MNAIKQGTHAPEWHSSHLPQLHNTSTISQFSARPLRKLEFTTNDREMVEITCQTTEGEKCM